MSAMTVRTTDESFVGSSAVAAVSLGDTKYENH